jgi:hypothetical protein
MLDDDQGRAGARSRRRRGAPENASASSSRSRRSGVAMPLAPSGRTSYWRTAPRTDGGPRRQHPGAAISAPNGTVAGVYEKGQLVPFAGPSAARRGRPARALRRVRSSRRGRDTTAGDAHRSGRRADHAGLFQFSRASAYAPHQLAVTLTNDSWVARAARTLPSPATSRSCARRAARFLVRASTAGPLVVDPWAGFRAGAVSEPGTVGRSRRRRCIRRMRASATCSRSFAGWSLWPGWRSRGGSRKRTEQADSRHESARSAAR